MKCIIPEISWHNRDSVLTVDVQPTHSGAVNFYRIASGGIDTHVLIWHATPQENGSLQLDCVCDLTRHQKAVNVVRFSPSGTYLASADDESFIIIWKQKTDDDSPEFPSETEEDNREHWIQVKTLRGHLNDVYDLAWSPDSTSLISGSVDNTAIVWDFAKGKKIKILDDDSNFIQGVAWDPQNQYVSTLSSDGKMRTYCSKTFKLLSRVSRGRLPGSQKPSADTTEKPLRLFHDDTLKTFFRRLNYSPDGQLLSAPAGMLEQPEKGSKPLNVTWIFLRRQLNAPVLYYPSLKKSSTVVKWCPIKFELKDDSSSLFLLPYRMVLAVATLSTILLYDTQHAVPIAFISNIHYTKITDLSWSTDGRMLIASSSDGYCSIVTFAKDELGVPYHEKVFELHPQKL